MSNSPDKKVVLEIEKKDVIATAEVTVDPVSARETRGSGHNAEAATQQFRAGIKALEAERAELLKRTLENVRPGRTFDSAVLRQINKLETLRNRMIVGHFAQMLKYHPSDVHAIVHQIIEL